MLNIDLAGKRALVAGVADDGGFGFSIAKSLAEAGASVCVATWPPALTIFTNLLERGKLDDSRRLSDGSLLTFEKIYPLDAAFDAITDAPEELRASKRYKDVGDFSIDGLTSRLVSDFGDKSLDILVHSLANGPDVKKQFCYIRLAVVYSHSQTHTFSVSCRLHCLLVYTSPLVKEFSPSLPSCSSLLGIVRELLSSSLSAAIKLLSTLCGCLP